VPTNCGKTTNFDVNQIVFSDDQLGFTISTSEDEKFQMILYDAQGKLITSQLITVSSGLNTIQIDRLNLSRGIYMLSLVGEKNYFSSKVLKN